MTNPLGNLWILQDVPYLTRGSGLGTHYLKVTANSLGLETYNYVPVTVVDQTPAFTVAIQQDKTDVQVGETVTMTAVPTNGTPDYFYDWDINYDGVSFKPEITGENVQWDWDTAGYYTIRVRCKDQAREVAWADTNVTVGGVKPAIHVVSPNGGEVLTAGTSAEIQWSSVKVNGTVFIEYSKDDFVSDIITIAKMRRTTDRIFSARSRPTIRQLRKYGSASTNDPTVNDISDGYFTIKKAGGCGPGPSIFTDIASRCHSRPSVQ